STGQPARGTGLPIPAAPGLHGAERILHARLLRRQYLFPRLQTLDRAPPQPGPAQRYRGTRLTAVGTDATPHLLQKHLDELSHYARGWPALPSLRCAGSIRVEPSFCTTTTIRRAPMNLEWSQYWIGLFAGNTD